MNARIEQFTLTLEGIGPRWTGQYRVRGPSMDVTGMVKADSADTAFAASVIEAEKVAKMIDRNLEKDKKQ